MSGYDYAVRRVVRVVDGDTYELELDLGLRTFSTQRVRLLGVDCPEEDADPGGWEVAARYATSWLAKHEGHLRASTHKMDGPSSYTFGRWLAVVYARPPGAVSRYLAEELLTAGLAVPRSRR